MDKKAVKKKTNSKNVPDSKSKPKGKSTSVKQSQSIKKKGNIKKKETKEVKEKVELKENNYDNRKNSMIFIGIVIAIVAAFLFINEGEQKILKNEFKIGEVGYVDNIELTLVDVYYINNNTGIEVSFEVTNKRDNTITMIPDDYFMFYDINKVQIPNKFDNDKNIIKKDETITYKLQYDVTQKELYEIYFYSQVAENNIKFSFTSSDIKHDNLMENSSLDNEIYE